MKIRETKMYVAVIQSKRTGSKYRKKTLAYSMKDARETFERANFKVISIKKA